MHSLLQPLEPLAIASNLAALCLQSRTNGAGAHRQLDGLFEDRAEGFLVVAPEAPEAVVVGLKQAGHPAEQGEVLAAGDFEFAGGTKVMEVAGEPYLEQQARA